jgi:hypothetical protein
VKRDPEDEAQPVVSERRLSAYANRFLYIWGGLSLVMFAIAAVLTGVLVRVSPEEPPYHPVGMYGTYHGPAQGWIYYYRTPREGNNYLIYYPAGTRAVALPYGKLERCTNELPVRAVIPSKNIRTMFWESGQYYLVALSARPSGSVREGKATCTIGFTPTRDSFTEFSIDYWFLPSLPIAGSPVTTLNVSATLEGAANMQVFGERATSSSSAALEPDDEIIIRYSDVRLLSLRDIMLVIIGALVALGASMALEAIRPYIELVAAGRG